MCVMACTVPAISGCGALAGPRACTDLLVMSVNVIVEDAGGTVNDATVEYSVDGGDFKPCEVDAEQEGQLGGSGSYACGNDVQGNFTIRATRGDQTATQMVTVGGDECHANPEFVTLTLEPES